MDARTALDPDSSPDDGVPAGAVRRTLEARGTDGDDDLLVREEPLLIRAGADAQLLTMRTPGDDRALVTGFLASEGAVSGLGAILDVELRPAAAQPDQPGDPVDEVHVRVAAADRPRLLGRLTRTHEVRSSCGVCGMSDPDRILEDTPPLLTGVPKLTLELLETMRAAFEQRQELFRATGACHGAAVFGPDGRMWAFGEDVGRHNALDKALGHALAGGYVLDRSVALLSGRAGFDLVIKCLRLRIPVIASVSAPSALSFDLCAAAGATLVGFLRPGRAKVYTDGSGRLGG